MVGVTEEEFSRLIRERFQRRSSNKELACLYLSRAGCASMDHLHWSITFFGLVLLLLLVCLFLRLQVFSTQPNLSRRNNASQSRDGSGEAVAVVCSSASGMTKVKFWQGQHFSICIGLTLWVFYCAHCVLICHFFRVRLCLWVSWLVLDWLF